MKNNIILIGMMGSGKTTIGKELHKKFPEYKLVDTDFGIEKETGMRIPEIFEKYGENYFRGLELRKIAALTNFSNLIISVGGGAFEHPKNRENLLNNGTVIFLDAGPKEIFNRIQNESHRPLLKNGLLAEKIEEILSKRRVNYEKAHYTIDTDGKTPYDIVEEIMEVLNDRT